MGDLVERLNAPANWLREDRGVDWKNAVSRYDRAPFEAAAAITQQRAAIKELVETLDNLIPRFHSCVVHSGSDPEFADLAVASARTALARAKEMVG